MWSNNISLLSLICFMPLKSFMAFVAFMRQCAREYSLVPISSCSGELIAEVFLELVSELILAVIAELIPELGRPRLCGSLWKCI